MEKEFVKVHGEKYYVIGGKLNFYSKRIAEIAEIRELEQLTNLHILDLRSNDITEI